MNNIPEDSMLRRHYLTELKSKQTTNFETFMNATQKNQSPEVTVEYAPIWSNQVLIPMAAFAFFMALVFLA